MTLKWMKPIHQAAPPISGVPLAPVISRLLESVKDYLPPATNSDGRLTQLHRDIDKILRQGHL